MAYIIQIRDYQPKPQPELSVAEHALMGGPVDRTHAYEATPTMNIGRISSLYKPIIEMPADSPA